MGTITTSEFREIVSSLIGKYEKVYNNSLDEYLRSLLNAIDKHASKNPSYSLFAVILEEAFRLNPVPFDERWLKYAQPPPNRLQRIIWQRKSKSFGSALPEFETGVEALSDSECLHRTVWFQIAETRRFAEKKPEEYGKYAKYASDYKNLGLTSPTGHVWYNWDTFTYLECAIAGLIANSKWTTPEFRDGNSWAVLACLLEWGRMYE